MKVLRMVIVRADRAPALDALERLVDRAGRFISLRMRGLACWKGMSRYGRSLPSAISGMMSSTCGYGIHVVQARPRAELGQALAQRLHARWYSLPRHSRSAYCVSTP
jgi:hypothetical protein